MLTETVTEAAHVDPVCGMTVDPAAAAGASERGGETFYFCSPGCKAKFDAAKPGVQSHGREEPARAGCCAASQHEAGRLPHHAGSHEHQGAATRERRPAAPSSHDVAEQFRGTAPAEAHGEDEDARESGYRT